MSRRIVSYLGGPLDGLQLDALGRPDEELHTGAYVVVDGWGDRRAHYAPDVRGNPLVWKYRGVVTC